jgi:alcohol dehydrogenase
MLLGHEAAGRIEGVGAGVDLALGQRVVMTFLPRCGECTACATNGLVPCTAGSATNNAGQLLGDTRRLHRGGERVHHHLGVSGFATYAVVNRRSVVPVDDDVPADIAAVMGCAVLTGGGAVLNAGAPRPGDTVVVVGLGGVGMAALITALAQPDVRVVGVDALSAKLEAARALGAHSAMTPGEAAAQQLKAPIVVECAGNVRAFEAAIAMTAPGGRTITVGLPAPDAFAAVSPLGLVAEGRSIVGSYLGSAVPERDIPVFVDLWRTGRLPVQALISSTIQLGEINAGMDQLADGQAIRQVIRF